MGFSKAAFSLFAEAIAPKELLNVAAWAEKYRHIGKGTSDSPGRWDHARVPYMVEPMESVSEFEEVVFVSSAQNSKTESLILNTIGYYCHYDPSPVLCVLPDWDTCDELSRDRFDPMVRDTPVMRNLISNIRASSGDGIQGSTKHVKRFPGGRLNFVTANSPAALASKPIKIIVIDELDRCQQNAEGDVYTLARKRTETFQRNRKIIRTSTPTLKDCSPIMAAYECTDQRKYFVDCPHCQTEQQIVWGQFKWETIDTNIGPMRDVWYECPHCTGRWTERQRKQAVQCGRWKATATPHPGYERTVGYWIWAGYSLFTSMQAIVNEFYLAKDDKFKFQVFVNTVWGETWEDPDAEKMEHSALQKRCESYPRGVVPDGCLVLTAGVDVQLEKLVIVIRGWTKTLESYAIDWIELYGDTAQDFVWDELRQAIGQTFKTHSGVGLQIRRCAIDSSAFTNRVYEKVLWLKQETRIDCVAVKGNSSIDKPIVNRPTQVSLTINGKTKKRGIRLWSVGVSSAKTLLYQRLQIDPGLPYSYHWPQLPEDYFLELTSEKKVTKFSKGRSTMAWELMANRRNEVLDCEVYAMFSAMSLGLEREGFDWDMLETSMAVEDPETQPIIEKTHDWRDRY